jgi:polysaccharide export outer membrane protein
VRRFHGVGLAALVSASLALPVSAQMNGVLNPQQQQQFGQAGFGQGGFGQAGGISGQPSSQPGQSDPSSSTYSPAATATVPTLSAVPASAALAATPIQSTNQAGNAGQANGSGQQQNGSRNQFDDRNRPVVRPAVPGEFETYVRRVMGRALPRFGSALLIPEARDFTLPATAAVPGDYRLNPGDELQIGLSGSVESELRLTIDNDGRVFVPRVGAVNVAGVRYADVQRVLAARIGRQFRDFKLSVTVASLHGIRVYVTGYAANPGAYAATSLSTLVNAVLAAGGPASGGSFRSIQLRRGGRTIADFDLYDLLLRGDKSKDLVLENEDVIFIAPVGAQVALTGSVNSEAIYEARPGENLGELLRFGGGVATLADPSRVIVSRLSELDRQGWVQLDMARATASPVAGGDILRVLSVADFARPLEKQAVLVTIEGEVAKPGHYYLPPNASFADAMALAGGLTSRAFVFGTEFDRTSVQQQQVKSYNEAIQQLELSLAAAPLTAQVADIADAASRTSQLSAARAVIDRLREQRPDGRVVLRLAADATSLPGNIVLENNDRLYIPPVPTTVGVFGAVFRPGSFQIEGPRRVRDYLADSGGPQRIADRSEIFVVRANGQVLTSRHGALNAQALPGDVVFVPIKTHASGIWTKIRDVASLLLSFGLTGAAIAAIGN